MKKKTILTIILSSIVGICGVWGVTLAFTNLSVSSLSSSSGSTIPSLAQVTAVGASTNDTLTLQNLTFANATGSVALWLQNGGAIVAGNDATYLGGKQFDFSQTIDHSSSTYFDNVGLRLDSLTKNFYNLAFNPLSTTNTQQISAAFNSEISIPSSVPSQIAPNVEGGLFVASHAGSGPVVGSVIGVNGEAYYTGTKRTSGNAIGANLIGVSGTAFPQGGPTSTIPSSIGVFAASSPFGNSGLITNNYGMYIDSAQGTMQNNFGLYIVGSQVDAASSSYGIYLENQKDNGFPDIAYSIYSSGGDVDFENGNLAVNQGSVSGTSLLASGTSTIGGLLTATTTRLSGYLGFTTSTVGTVLRSPNGTCYLMGITDSGGFTTSTATCP